MLEIGSLIEGKYRVLHQIGKGGMSNVYLALNEKVNKQWAIKEVRKNVSTDHEVIRQNLIKEAKILTKLRHPHLPSIVDVIDREDTFLIVMDYIEGITLKDKLKDEGAQPQEDVIDWAMQICSVLGYLHAQDPPIIYRDTKPANIMIKPDGNVVLIDFGTAREFKENNEEDTMNLGTRGYAAPEQYGGKGQTDPRTDIYNLGVTMYQLVTGKNPAKPPYELRPIRQWDPKLSGGLEKIIIKCTKNDPQERYQTADELMDDLMHYTELEEEFLTRKKKENRLFLAVIIAALCCIGAGLGTGAYASSLKQGTYEAQLRAAETSPDTGGRISALQEAVMIDPKRADAYEELLNNVYLADGNFTKQEAEEMTRILGYKGAKDLQTTEEKFSSNKEGYESFAFDMGLAYFYYYEDSGNKSLSKSWFRIAKDSETLQESKKERAERFYQISEYYTQLQSHNKAGDNTVSYKDYWNDLVILSAGDIAHTDNIRTALVVYKELTYQISTHAADFKAAGITKDALEDELAMVEKKISGDIETSPDYAGKDNEELAGQIMENIVSARHILDTTFQTGGDE